MSFGVPVQDSPEEQVYVAPEMVAEMSELSIPVPSSVTWKDSNRFDFGTPIAPEGGDWEIT